MDIQVRTEVEDDEISEIRDLYGTYSSWADHSEEDVRRAVNNSDEVVGLYDKDEERFVASARILTDYTYYAVVYDVVVHCTYRRQGLGKRLMEAVTNYSPLEPVAQVTLVSRDGLTEFYEECGFEVHPMELEIDGRTEDFFRMRLVA